ncbi:uncharacterized protein LOC118348968 [Juglans regia]|uniref:Uncharacterized protein LOC118348968 n=1 Tax=Juglans regia TaxID=51240 RepID=A0A6P9EGT3_JUGRE|nr:uncharacterized protein LOC118348968 [Juglans regia]
MVLPSSIVSDRNPTFTRDKPKEWSKRLPMSEWWYNMNWHASTKSTSFEAVYGYPPLPLLPHSPGTTSVQAVEEALRSRDHIVQLFQENLHEAYERMKRFGPYKILELIGNVAYRLELPPGTLIHSVFHVSCLNKKLGNQNVQVSTIPLVAEDGRLRAELEQVLERCMKKKGHRVVTELLVKWQGLGFEDVS